MMTNKKKFLLRYKREIESLEKDQNGALQKDSKGKYVKSKKSMSFIVGNVSAYSKTGLPDDLKLYAEIPSIPVDLWCAPATFGDDKAATKKESQAVIDEDDFGF